MTAYTNTAETSVHWQRLLAQRTEGMKSSAIRELLKITQRPDVISFAGGLPAPELFPIREIEEACRYLLREEPKTALQYSTTEGHPPLRAYLARSMSNYGIERDPDDILITTGSQQALDLIGKTFIDPGSKVLTGRPTYLGAIQGWRAYQAEFVTVPLDDDGMQVDEIENTLEAHDDVRFIYVLPNFHNPAGTTLPEDRRRRLVEIAREADLIIVEDDPYGALRYEGKSPTPISALAPERTLYLGTFSKTLTPGLRIGWVAGPREIRNRLVLAKQGSDLHTSTFDQMIANDIAQRGIIEVHVEQLKKTYGSRRDTMVEALCEFWPDSCCWTRPQGGLFLWARIPGDIDTNEMLHEALENKVAFVPGVNFYPYADGGHQAMRLNFSNAKPEMIVEGIRRLGLTVKQTLR